MPRLLINAPSGLQEIIEISATGNYFDAARIIWDERTDGPLPDITPGKMQRSGDQLITLDDFLLEHLAAVLTDAKAEKIIELTSVYEAATYANIEHASKTWKADRDSQQLLAAVLSVGSVPESMYWRDVTESQNPMSFSDLQALAGAILVRGLLVDSNLAAKKAAVEAATTLAEVDAITW